MSESWDRLADPNTEAALFNAARATVVLVVEGHDDADFWRSRVLPGVQVRVSNGRDRALKQAATARDEGQRALITIVDADFDRLQGGLPAHNNVFYTDDHDLDVMLVRSPALDKVLVERASEDKRHKFVQARGRSVLHHLLKLGVKIGQLRLLSHQDGLRLTFRKSSRDETYSYFDLGKCCDDETWELDRNKLFDVVVNFSGRHELHPKRAEILLKLPALPAGPPEQLCNGHDLIRLLALGLRRCIGPKARPAPTHDDLQRELRLAFELPHLRDTQLYRDLLTWQSQHPPLRLLA